jgi:hypothetical protein
LRNSFLGVGTIGLQPADGLALGYRAQLKDDGTFTLPSVGLSAFYVNVVGLRSNAYVKSIRSGTQDITNQPLDLSSGSAGPLDIVVSSKAAEVSGTVRTRKGEAMFGVRVTLWPKSPIPGRVAGGVRQAATDQNGGFQLTGLPPGDYFLAAWEVLDPGLAVAEFLALFNTVASPINLLESAKQNLNLEPILSDRVTAELDKLP